MSKHLLAPWSRRTLLGRRRQQRSAVISVGVGLLTATCKQDPPAPPPPTAQALIIKSVNTGAMVAEQLRAAIEMQHAGEPLAEAMGRDLAGYDRCPNDHCPDDRPAHHRPSGHDHGAGVDDHHHHLDASDDRSGDHSADHHAGHHHTTAGAPDQRCPDHDGAGVRRDPGSRIRR